MDPLDKNPEAAYRQDVVTMDDWTYQLERRKVLEAIACAVHQQNKVYCESLGDFSQVAWSEAPDWQRQSAIDGVKNALDGATPEQSHENWCKTRRDDGWVYGPTKDPVAKTHHCLVPYGDLPEDQKRKDHLFIEMVNQIARTLGLPSSETKTA